MKAGSWPSSTCSTPPCQSSTLGSLSRWAGSGHLPTRVQVGGSRASACPRRSPLLGAGRGALCQPPLLWDPPRSAPLLWLGADVTAAESLLMPELYVAGQEDKLFNYWVFFQAVAHGTATSLVNFFVTLWVGHNSVGPSSFGDYQSFAVIVAVSGLLSITLEVILIIRYWTVLCLLTILLSLGSYVVMTYATQSLWLWKMAPKTFPFLFADRNVLAHPSNLLVILLNVSLNTLPVLAFRVIHKTLRKPCRKQEEETPSEDIAAVEPVPYLRREAPTRRSSYAFSHREGYAELITQGTILRPSPRSNSEEAYESLVPSDDELSPSSKESRSHTWKVSVLKRSGHQHQGRASSDDTQPYTTGSSCCAVEGPGSAQESRSFPENQSQFFTGPSWPSGRASESQSESPEGRPSFWTPFRKSWPNAWQKEPHPAKEETAPLPSKTQTSPAETLPPTVEESSLSEQPMEVEPWEVERQPSPMEWLPADAAEQPSPAPSGPFAAPQRLAS
uniref:P-type ATPase C-terminal domain-containing protein n=1 Tax=Sciurus vulgaris TaxID=55149 RepID=A0A8D2DGD2_SCIVU